MKRLLGKTGDERLPLCNSGKEINRDKTKAMLF